MKIGIVSDSHGKAGCLRAALELLASHCCEAVVHCGDIGSTECVELLGAAGMPAYAVAGNMDHHVGRLESAANECGVKFAWEVVEVPLAADQFLVATHGDDVGVLAELIEGGQFPYVCHGHTHCTRDERFGNVRVIGPGAIRHPRHPRHPTVVVLDTDTDTLQFIKVDP